ncbi:hypothetical protein [Glaesserella parasuis]|uniref:Neck protein n=1 Tax=Glaesserella parasuis TaxID=738 RepID=A0AAJ6ABE4_GLAPU|nr:hypothetical protein [Glaesserella parasuis]MCT8721017.1 hypothetical protein [Glaesserella parasuis]MCT8727426.1 hypothetical protein [Glaesserella parasuis]MDG6346388.1 hypothetical protein [Glaesserella parasuis]MDG6448500.1 hypothetical protein [Glaesserella parasuis]MDO9664714.1 hypothetical protein [Glaesserella parasuis]
MSRADKFRKALQAKIDNLSAAKNKVAKVGIVEHQHYDDNTPVAYVASIHEYGARFTVPERKATIYRKVDKNGEWTGKHGSKFVKKKASNFATEVTIPAHMVNIPARPFMRPTISEKKGEWAKIGKQILQNGGNVDSMLEMVGLRASADIVDTISRIDSPPLQKATIKARNRKYKSKSSKSSTKPLEDTKILISSISHIVTDKGD